MGYKGKHVLVTSGPAAVALDDVRVITNRSTGEMGRLIADALHREGARVTLLEGSAATSRLPLPEAIALKRFYFYDELDQGLVRELRKGYDVVIHAAAVPDFRPARACRGKMASGQALTLKLIPTKKLIGKIKQLSPRSLLVGFKLATRKFSGAFPLNVKDLFDKAGCDLVVANAYVDGNYQACLFGPQGRVSPEGLAKKALVKVLINAIGLQS